MKRPISQVIIAGIATCFIVVSVALLASNKPEFIAIKVLGGTPSDLLITNFDTVLYLSYLIGGLSSAIIANKLGKRKVLILTGSIGAGCSFLLLVIVPIYEIILILRFIQGLFTVLSWQMLMTLLLDISSIQDRGKNMGIYGIFMAIGMGSGPVLGGFLADVDVYMPYYFAIGFNTIATIVIFFLLDEPKKLLRKPSISEAFNLYRKNPGIIVPGIFNFIDRLHMGFKLAILPIFIKNVLGLNPSLRGMVLGINALPFIILQYPIGKISDRKGRFSFLILGSIGYGITLSLIGYLGSFSFINLIVLYIILGVFSGITGPPSSALIGDLVEHENNAMAMGFFNMLGNFGIIIGPLFGGLLATASNYVLTFIVAGIIELVALGICILISKRFNIMKDFHPARITRIE